MSTPLSPEEKLILAAASLRSGAGTAYDSFLSALQAYNEKQKDELVSSAPDALQRNQGICQATGRLLTLLRFDREKVEQIQAKGQNHYVDQRNSANRP